MNRQNSQGDRAQKEGRKDVAKQEGLELWLLALGWRHPRAKS